MLFIQRTIKPVLAFGIVPALLAGLSACNGSGNALDIAASSSNPSVAVTPKTRYDLANGCYALKSLDSNTFATRTTQGFASDATQLSKAEPFYMKPTALGEYLFYAHDQSMLSVSGTGIGAVTRAVEPANWTINTDSQGRYTVTSASAGKSLTASQGQLALSDTLGHFSFVPTTGCTTYPEISTDSSGETYKGRGIDKPVVGFAEVHTHMAMGHEMSDGRTTVGPASAGVMYGQMFHRFGVPHAMEDCTAFHGQDGSRDPEALILDMTPGTTHDTQGWPTFIDWPAHASQLHQAMYYKWVERAWQAGMRVMVSEGTNIEALCEVGRTYATTINPAAAGYDCKDMSLGMNQVRYLLQLEKYVDAQEGGPGKGWFRIVRSPSEARQVINEGKLAVIAGLEFSNIFECKLTYDPLGNETSDCTKEKIDQQIKEAWDLGVRELFPYHDVNSSLGGTGIFNGDVLNLVGFYGTRRFWETEDCPDGGEGEKFFYNAGAYMTTAIPGTGSDPLTQAIIPLLQGTAPIYKPDVRQCNQRGMTELGEYAMQEIMKKKFIIDIDHASLKAKQKMLDMANAQTPKYPLISAHGGHGGITIEQAKNILANKGVIYPFKPNGKGHVSFINQLKPVWQATRGNEQIAVGYGMDANGIADRAGPRGADSKPVIYPFTLFQGEDWNDPLFAGIAPITFKLQTQPESGKTWNIDEVGTAHYGMVADYVEEIRLEGGKEALKALYQSAEAYLQMWEQTYNR